MAKPRRLKAEAFKRNVEDLLDWVASDAAPNAEIARVGDMSRQLIIRAQRHDWDPPFSTIYALAQARDIIEARPKKKQRPTL